MQAMAGFESTPYCCSCSNNKHPLNSSRYVPRLVGCGASGLAELAGPGCASSRRKRRVVSRTPLLRAGRTWRAMSCWHGKAGRSEHRQNAVGVCDCVVVVWRNVACCVCMGVSYVMDVGSCKARSGNSGESRSRQSLVSTSESPQEVCIPPVRFACFTFSFTG